jgi:hypothetical protein
MSVVSTITAHGTVYLSARVTLEHSRSFHPNAGFIVVDGVIPSGQTGCPPIVCSFRHNLQNNEGSIVDGSYRIVATVSLSISLSVIQCYFHTDNAH